MKSLLRPITVWLQASVPGHTKKLVVKLSTTIINNRLMFLGPISIHQIRNKISNIFHKIKVHTKKSSLIISIWKNVQIVNMKLFKLSKKLPAMLQNLTETVGFVLIQKPLTNSKHQELFQGAKLITNSKTL